ncbi:MAG: prolipoprotein diacylglyceryl transferase [Verrucomicrobia bacterium]|nr:prolipoprotein diacylglyceryl transferase [Verrucomicrobiota bacterium]MBU4246826.1 prolipoprotein diacylglyceryl transferase [Verrucomicrobiota bacterium]MBU4291820.1 prolipoprotein diacylglyceryl transferase [Verrucomicrobiota bacterium]MBU4429422.1 prolipoprotein diacylglyceryl transferase [Verrucomicrobiota bacterium]MCG2680819.1 prolipoprotein diacylglyceryl transferase [Kiritimatiellia bacterium]
MNPVCFHIGQRPIYWYGLMVATAFIACMAHLTWLGKKEGRPAAFVSDLGCWIIIGAIVGARLAYVLANWPAFAAAPGMILRLDQGGLIYYGGFVGAVLLGIVYARVKREPLWPLADFVATALPLGHAIGRIGCFLNGCCYGSLTAVPWGVSVDGILRHPVQLYEAAGNLILYTLMLFLYRRRPRDGRLFALYLILYPLIRLGVEYFRGDDRLRWLGLTLAQDLSLVFMLIGLGLWFLLPRRAASASGVSIKAMNTHDH